MAPIHDFRCKECAHVDTKLVQSGIRTIECSECGNESTLVFLTPPKLDWLGMGSQKNVSPEFQEKFDKMHRKQRAKEEAFEKEHGEGEYYNRTPGG